MLGSVLKDYVCPACENVGLNYDPSKTFNAYSDIFEIEDVEGIIDGFIADYLVYRCDNCGAEHRLSFKEIEKFARKDISNRVMKLKASAELDRGMGIRPRYFIFCGVCSGFDGNGSCPSAVYDTCKIRRIPNVL
jgi:hypothetical protein